MQVAVKDVYLKRPISLLSPKLEMNKSSAEFTQSDSPISSGDPGYPNRLRVMSTSSSYGISLLLSLGQRELFCKSNVDTFLMREKLTCCFSTQQHLRLFSRCLKTEFKKGININWLSGRPKKRSLTGTFFSIVEMIYMFKLSRKYFTVST